MTRFIIRRLIQAIPTFFGITLLAFLIMVLAPGDPISLMFFDPNISQETRAAQEDRLGVNDPLPIQYLRWLVGDDWMTVDEELWYNIRLEDGSEGWISDLMMNVDQETGEISLTASRQPYREAPSTNAEVIGRISRRDTATAEVVDTQTFTIKGDRKGILRGDFGRSFSYRRPPLEMIMERLPATIELNIAVVMVSVTLGVVVGVLSAIWRGRAFDQFSRVLAVVGDSVPSFWLAFMVILLFATPGLGLFPMGERCAHVRGGCPPIYDRLEYLILPTLVLALGGVAGWSRYIRASMLENINSDYIRTAKSKGLPSRLVWFRHALRNALIPMATFLGPTFVGLLGGSVVIEQIFGWPGIGRLTLEALQAQDYPIVMTSVVIGALLTIIAYLISDILYAVFDPRIRL